MRLRTGLLLLVLATAVPLVAFALLASALVVRHQQDNYITAVKDRNRAFMSAVDAELKGTIVTLEALTANRALAEGDLRRFHRTAVSVLDTQPAWFNVILLKPEGGQMVNAAIPWGTALGQSAYRLDSLRAVVNTLRPAVGSIVLASRGPFVNRPGIPVGVPVMREGRLAYILAALVRPEAFQDLIMQQKLPTGWVSGLVDADGQFIARVPRRPIGSLASPDYLRAVRAASEGWYRGKTAEGLDTYTAHVSSDLSGWSVGFAIPASLVLGGAERAAWLMGGGVGLSLALAVAIALWLGRRIAGPIAELSSTAHGLGASGPPVAVHTPIREVADLAQALNDASQAIRTRDAELRRSEERFRLSQESAVQGFTLFKALRDEHGKVVDLEYEYINPAGAALGHARPEALIGRRLSEMFPGTEQTGIGAGLRRVVETGESLDTELRYEADGVAGWYRHLAVKIGDGVGTSYIDITAEKRLEQELKERADALARADRNKSEFLAMLSHELRNPLAPLTNALTLLKARGDKGTPAQLYEMMDRQLRQLVRLIDDLLDISRIDRGKLEMHCERVAADAIVRQAVEIARPNLESRRHELVLRYPGTPPFLEADPVRMAQVLSNVLNNAAKFTPPGGRIEVTLKSEGEDALIAVADDGIGVEPGDLERIFDMFVQLDSSRSQAAGGLGLGLTLARTIVERHGGRVHAESAGPGKGTRFVIRLPAAPAPKIPAPLRPVPRPSSGGRRVLVVDDNVDAATSLATVLELAGHEVRTAFGGMEALGVAEAFRPEYVMLDLNLPGLDGVEVGRRLRASDWGRRASLVALTGMGQPADLARTRQAGFDHHLTKPVEPEEVLRLVAAGR